jgi:PDZ domain
MHMRVAFNAYWYWYVALSCAAIVFLIISQYLITLVWVTYKKYKLRSAGRRALARMRNLRPGEPLEPQLAASADMPLAAGAEIQPIFEPGETPEPQPAASADLPLAADAEIQPILEPGEEPEPQPAVSSELALQVGARLNWLLSHGKGKTWGDAPKKFVQVDIEPKEMDSNVEIAALLVGDIGSCVSALLPTGAEAQPILEPGEAPEPQPAASADLPLPAGAEAQPILEPGEAPEPQPAVSLDLRLPASAEVQPILEPGEAPEPQPAVIRNVNTAKKDYDRAITNNNGTVKLDPKFGVTYERRSVTKSKMGDKAGADADLEPAKAIRASISGKHVKFGRLADASEKKEAALPPNEESTPEDKSSVKNARAFKGSIGVSIRRVTDGAAQRLNVKPARGALVVGIDKYGPAKAAGIELDDVIVKIDGKDVNEVHDLPRFVADAPAGEDIAVTILREGKELTKTVKVCQLEDSDKQESFNSKNGSASQEIPVAVDPRSQVAAKHLAPGEVPQQLVSNVSFFVPPAPPRFGRRPIDHFSNFRHRPKRGA